jgi:hypothetical protein
VPLPSVAGRPDMTIKRAAADRTGARPSYGAGGRAARSCYFLGLHTLRNNSLPVSPFLERFLDTSDPEVHKGQPFSYDLADSLGPQEFEGPLAFVRRIVWATELVLGMPNSAAISL